MIPRKTSASKKRARSPFIERAALRIAGLYFLIGILWVVFSNNFVQAIAPTQNVFMFIMLYRGWVFILITAIALYFLISRMVSRVHQLDIELSQRNLDHQLEMGHYRLLLEASQDNIILFDAQKRYLAITDRGAATVERQSAQLLGHTPIEVLDIQLGAAIEDTLEMVISTRQPLQGTWSMHDNNQQHWFEVIYNPVLDENGNLTAILAISRDVTDKTLANEKLSQQYKMLEFSEAEYRQLLDSVDDMIYRVDAAGNQVYLNAKGREIEELADGEAVHAPMTQFIHPDDYEQALPNYRQQVETDGVMRINTRIIGKRGRVTHVSHQAKLVRDESGKVTGILGVGRDVTQQLQQEEALANHARQQAAVAHLGQRVLEGISVPGLMIEIVNLIVGTLNIEIAGIFEFTPDKKELLLRAGVGWKDDATFPIYPAMDLQPKVVDDIRSDNRLSAVPVLVEHNVVSTIHVNIQGPDGRFGLLAALATTHRIFTQDDAHFLEAIANMLGATLIRAKAQLALRDSAEQNRAIVTTAGDGIITINDSGIIESFNPAAERIFGYSASEAIGQHIDNLILEGHSETVPSEDATVSKLNEQSMGQRQDRSLFPIELTVSEMQLGGRTMFTNIVRDITERMLSIQAVGQHLRRLEILNHILEVASAPTGFERILEALLKEICEVFNADAADIHLMDANVGLLYLLAHLGYKISEDEKYRHLAIKESLRGAATLEGHVVAYTAPFPPIFQPFTAKITEVKSIAITPIWARGEIRGTLAIMLWSERIFSEQDLALLQALGRGIGITIENARLYAEAQSYAETLKIRIDERTEALQKALIHAQSADRAKSALLNTVSHEMKTPLSSIIGFSGLILSRKPELEKTLEYSSAINAEARRLSDLITDFLDLQRIESGRELFRRTEVDLADLVRDVVRKYPYDETMFTIQVNLVAMPFAYADSNRIRQVIINLLSNALKYSPNGGPISISLRRDGNEAVFSIHDEGLGLPPDDVERVFETFYRGEAAERLRIRGTGLGLGLCYEIIQLHNGRIWCESKGQNLGSTFSFALPLPQSPIGKLGVDDGRLKKLIVLAEDDPHLSIDLIGLLELQGYRTRTIPFKSATLAYLTELKPALIVLDLLQINVNGGWTLLNTLKGSPATASVPILVFSGLKISDEAMNKGAAAFVSRPLDETVFVREVTRLMEMVALVANGD